MGKTKAGNANAQRNNNAKQKNDYNNEFASYAEVESNKMKNRKKEE
ncbi:hypothetical protein ACSVDA_15970 [Cytobacillus sp. Hm23]|nr:hypothetical protein [Cytobacillus sp. IB215665]MDX8366510.1 hypothetical protein [Cytobacillus sp. IB215665]